MVARAKATGFDEAARAVIRIRSRGLCEIRWAPDCRGVAGDGEPHHRKLRRHGDHRPVNGLDTCPPCHRWAHDNVAAARVVGVIVASWHDAASVPVTVGPHG